MISFNKTGGSTIKPMFVIGTRPEVIKMAPVILKSREYTRYIDPVTVVTGQHKELLVQALETFRINPDIDMNIMKRNQTLTSIVTKILREFEQLFSSKKPDIVFVQGDTSTSFAASLAASFQKIPVAHIEAGLRTYNKFNPFPEEINRKLISTLADLHFAPTEKAVSNLQKEGISRESIILTGNTVIDALLFVANQPWNMENNGLNFPSGTKLILATPHRRENIGPPLINICNAIKKLATVYSNQISIIFSVHKNPLVRSTVNEMLKDVDNVFLREPIDYRTFVHLMKQSYFILTDSGGIQEEAAALGKPVLVLREQTERPETVQIGTAKVIGTNTDDIFNEAEILLTNTSIYDGMSHKQNPFGDGRASERIIKTLLNAFNIFHHKVEEFDMGSN